MKTSLAASIREGIRMRIETGEWESRIPSEPELAQLFDASRETVRKALGVLEAEGLLYRIHGKGTFVDATVSFNPLSDALSITEELAHSHLPVKNTVLESGWIRPVDIPSTFLRNCFAEDPRVFRLKRLRISRDQTWAVEVSYFRESVFPGIESADFSDSLHRLMTSRYRLSPDRVRNRLQALDFRLKADKDTAAELGSRQAVRVERVLDRKRNVYYAVSFTMRTDLYPLEFTQLPTRSGGGIL